MTTTTETGRHTPGPWKQHGDNVWHPIGPFGSFREGVIVAKLDTGTKMISASERAANARLIAAAPDLLAACQAVLSIPADEPGRIACLVPQLTAARDKALGNETTHGER